MINVKHLRTSRSMAAILLCCWSAMDVSLGGKRIESLLLWTVL
jgi:hypothetical protein